MLVNNVWGPHFYSVGQGPYLLDGKHPYHEIHAMKIHAKKSLLKIHAIKIHAIKIHGRTFCKFMPWPGGANVRPMPIATWTVDMETVKNHHNDSIQNMLTKKDPVLTATASVASIL